MISVGRLEGLDGCRVSTLPTNVFADVMRDPSGAESEKSVWLERSGLSCRDLSDQHKGIF